MDRETILENVDYLEFGKRFLTEYLERGLGSLSKRETDVLVMHLLEEHGALGLRANHDLSLGLRLTEARVRNLRYEVRLKFPPEEERFMERRLLFVLAVAQYEVEARTIVFVIEDSFLRTALQAHLKRKGAFADTSFNSELVKVSLVQLGPLLEEFYGEDLAGNFIRGMEKAVKKEKFTKLRASFVNGAAKILGGGAVATVRGLLGGA